MGKTHTAPDRILEEQDLVKNASLAVEPRAYRTTFTHTPVTGDELGAFLLERLSDSNVIVPQSDVDAVLWGGKVNGQPYAGWVEKTGLRSKLRRKAEQSKDFVIRVGEPFAYNYADLPESLHKFLATRKQEQGDEIATVQSGSTASETLSTYLMNKHVKPKNILYRFMDDVAKDNGYTGWTGLNSILGGTRLTITQETREKHVTRAHERLKHEESLEEVMQAYYPHADASQKATFTASMEDLSRRALSGSKKELTSALKDSALSTFDFYKAVDAIAQMDSIETAQAQKIHQYVTKEQAYENLAKRRLAGEKAIDLLDEWNAQHDQKMTLSTLYRKTSKHR